MKDQLSICPRCGSDACYITPVNEAKNNYYCFGCGFQTNDLMVEGEFDFESYEETLPELYKDIKSVDDKKRVWYPITINIQEKGTVFANGTHKDNWQWSGILAVEVSDEEKGKFKIPGTEEFYTHKTDIKTLKSYSQNDFIEALDYIGFFNGQ
jgi:hypothetical protein